MTKTYKSDVYAATGNSGEYIEVKRRNGEWVARTVELFVHGPDRVGKWEPASERDLRMVGVAE